VGKERVLLELVEAVEFIDKEDDPLVPGLLDDLLDLLYAYGDGGKRDVGELHYPADEPADGGLADAARSPEDERGNVSSLDEDLEELSLSEEVLLADDIIERSGPYPVRERFL